MTLEDLRRQYTIGGLLEDDVPDDPIVFFANWLQTALDNAPQEWVEPYAMTLATSSRTGEVTARIVLLRGCDTDGFVFFTNYESAKGQQLLENQQASLVFYWGYLERQVRVSGTVQKVSREQSESYFRKRPRGSQVGAAVSRQSQVIESRQFLESAVQEFTTGVGDQPVPLPDDWGGYLVVPTEIEFWQGRENRLHDRLVYIRSDDNSWQLKRLSP